MNADRDPRVRASREARRVADELGVDLSQVIGSGPNGRITRGDVEWAARDATSARPEATPERSTADAPPPPPGPDGGDAGPAGERTRASSAIPGTMTAQRSVSADDLLRLRQRLATAAGDGPHPTLGHLVVRAAAVALDGARTMLAVGTLTDGGLELTTLDAAETLNVGEIAARLGDAAPVPATARPDGVIIDAGELDVDSISLMPESAWLMCVGRPVRAAAGSAGAARTLTLSITAGPQHDARAATALLARVAHLLEHPHALVL